MTTQTHIEQHSRLKYYETLEISILFSYTYSAWIDISDYLLSSNATEIENRLDFDSFGYGEFKTSSATFTMNNKDGKFNDVTDTYSIFSNANTRHYSKIRFKAGYIENGTKIDEIVFYGLLNEKTSTTDFINGEFKFTALSLNQILAENTNTANTITANMTVKQVVEELIDRPSVTKFITYNAANVNPYYNIVFDDATQFNGKKISDILDDICKKSSSIWYIDINGNFILDDRTPNSNPYFEFIGGSRGRIDTNILSVTSYDSGFSKIINQVKFDSDVYTGTNTDIYGTNEYELTGTDIITTAKKDIIGANILADNQTPKRRVVLKTVYMPNVISLKDKCTIDYKDALKYTSKPTLTFNIGEEFNNGYYFPAYSNGSVIKPDRYFVYYGYKHNIKEGWTEHYLIEGDWA